MRFLLKESPLSPSSATKGKITAGTCLHTSPGCPLQHCPDEGDFSITPLPRQTALGWGRGQASSGERPCHGGSGRGSAAQK